MEREALSVSVGLCCFRSQPTNQKPLSRRGTTLELWRRGPESNLSRFAGSERSGSPQAKSRAERGTCELQEFSGQVLEARAGIEPAHKGFADLSLTTWVPRPAPNLQRSTGNTQAPCVGSYTK